VGLAWGDEAKGACCDFLARTHGVGLVVRHGGGPQCSHNVVTPDGRHHTFAQFGSATFLPGVHTHLSRHMLINPMNMEAEESHLRALGVADAFERLTVDEECVVITPFQRALNRLTEWARGEHAHGSCGQGVGQARDDQIRYGNDRVLLAGDLLCEPLAKEKLRFMQQVARLTLKERLLGGPLPQKAVEEAAVIMEDSIDWCYWRLRRPPLKIVRGKHLATLVQMSRRVIFEGGQGVLLDEVHGTAPHNTWTDTTCGNANLLLSEIGFNGKVRRIGALRSYFTRHGAGPFPTEDAGLAPALPEPHNDDVGFQGAFRVGHFDAVAAKYAISVSGGVSEVALSHLDALRRLGVSRVRTASSQERAIHALSSRQEYEEVRPPHFVARIEQLLGLPVTIGATGPTAEDRSDFMEKGRKAG
jgi:adenylosuccinate synthase